MDFEQKPWGFEYTWADTPLYSAKMMVVKENNQTQYVYYKKMDITIFVLQGEIVLYEEGKNRTLIQGEKYHISPKIMYRIIALKSDATILQVSSPIVENDLVIVEA